VNLPEEAYRERLRSELAQSAAIFMQRLGTKPRFFSAPYGEYNRIVVEEIRAQGYDALLTEDPGPASCFTDPLSIPREPILGGEWSTVKHFRDVLRNVDLPLAEMFPPVSWKTSPQPARFGARVLHPERYVAGSFGVYVSELGWQKALLDGDVVYVSNDRRLSRPYNRVMVSAREKKTGRTAVRYWLLSQ
jgi:peptidoglycan/xylan/chitin deacetylase (PgdA/CDA1 family)